MTRQPHDQFAKSLLADFLAPLGRVEVGLEVTDEPRAVDLFFEPDPTPVPDQMGVLGLWIRLLGRGKVQKQAIAEVMGLGETDPERITILKLLNNWRIMLDQKQETL